MSNIETFEFSNKEIEVLTRSNKENAAQVNCLLSEECDFKVQNKEFCKF